MTVDDAKSQRGVESPVDLVRGTADVLPADLARLDGLEWLLMERFARAGYRPVRVPVLEDRSLHERKSGARILANLYQVTAGGGDPVCLRPEVTAGIVRAYNAAPGPPPLPWRVSYSGPVFRHLPTAPGVLREFHQVGVERLDRPGRGGDGDAEAIWLADWALAEAGVDDATIRVGHAGLIRDLLKGSGLPLGVQVALVDVLGEAAQASATGGEGAEATGDRVLSAMDAHLASMAAWLAPTGPDEDPVPDGDASADRLFRTLYPEVVGRRSGREVLGRLRRKWDLGHGLAGALGALRDRVRALADLRGPALEVLEKLRGLEADVPSLGGELRGLVDGLIAHGVDPARVELDLGFGRGIGFYSQMMFVLMAETPAGPVEACGGGRYDGLARALGAADDLAGVGFAFGLERLRDLLQARAWGGSGPGFARDETLLLAEGPDAHPLAAWLRVGGRAVVVEGAGSLAESVASARDRGFARVVVAGGPEGSIKLVDLNPGRPGRPAPPPLAIGSRDELLRLLPPSGGPQP